MAEFYDPSQLLTAVPLSPAMRSLVGTEELSEDDAVLALARRFGFAGETLDDRAAFRLSTGGGNTLANEFTFWQGYADEPGLDVNIDNDQAGDPVLVTMLRTIVRGLPDEYRNATFLNTVDVRPFLKELAGKNLEIRVDRPFARDTPVGTDDVGGLTPELISRYVVQFTNKNRDALLGEFAGSDNFDRVRTTVDQALTFGTVADRMPTPAEIGGTTATGSPLVDGFNTVSGSNDLSVDDLRKLFTRSGQTDIMTLESLYNEYGAMFDMPDDPMLDTAFARSVPVNPTVPRTADHTERAGTGAASPAAAPGTRLNYRAAADYLYSGEVTPSEIINLQRKMVAAGLFDGSDMADGYARGDAFDANTNRAWRTLLGQAFQRNLSVVDTIDVLTRERNERMPTLRENVNKRVFNLTAQQIIGRDLTDDEQAGLVSYLQNLRAQQGTAALGTTPDVGFASDDVNTFLADRFDSEIEGLGGARSLDAYKRAMRG